MPQTARSPQKNQRLTSNPSLHGSDPNINTVDLNTLNREELLNITKRIKRKIDESPSRYNVENKLDEIQASQDNKFDIITSSIGTLIEQNKELKNSIELLATRYDSLLTKVSTLEQENQLCRTKVQDLENKLDSLERQAKNTSIEIRNIPKSVPEPRHQLANTVKDIISTIRPDTPLQDLELRNIHRTKSGSVIVDFTTVDRKITTITKYREYNKTQKSKNEAQLNTHDLKLPGVTKTVYISDHLTTKTSHLYFLARQQLKLKKLNAAWTAYGKLFIKKEENDTAICIGSEEHLLHLIS